MAIVVFSRFCVHHVVWIVTYVAVHRVHAVILSYYQYAFHWSMIMVYACHQDTKNPKNEIDKTSIRRESVKLICNRRSSRVLLSWQLIKPGAALVTTKRMFLLLCRYQWPISISICILLCIIVIARFCRFCWKYSLSLLIKTIQPPIFIDHVMQKSLKVLAVAPGHNITHKGTATSNQCMTDVGSVAKPFTEKSTRCLKVSVATPGYHVLFGSNMVMLFNQKSPLIKHYGGKLAKSLDLLFTCK